LGIAQGGVTVVKGEVPLALPLSPSLLNHTLCVVRVQGLGSRNSGDLETKEIPGREEVRG